MVYTKMSSSESNGDRIKKQVQLKQNNREKYNIVYANNQDLSGR